MLCDICPRNCNVDRDINLGFCKSKNKIMVAKIMLHHFEEPCISGKNGSGAIFFCGCNMRCVFCQNYKISHTNSNYTEYTEEELANVFLNLQKNNAHNINLVTPTHFIDKIIKSILIAKNNGLTIPIIYNTSGYEKVETLKKLNGLIDVYLPDFKFYDSNIAKKYANCEDYPLIVKNALDEMLSQIKTLQFENTPFTNKNNLQISESHILKKGIIVRHLVLPYHYNDSKKIIKYLFTKYENKILISLMSQYTPIKEIINTPFFKKNFNELTKRISQKKFNELTNYMFNIGIYNAFIQDFGVSNNTYIPDF